MEKGNSSKNETSPDTTRKEKEKAEKVDKIEKSEKYEEDEKSNKTEAKAGPSAQDEPFRTLQTEESSSLKDDETAIEAIRRYMAEKLGFAEGKKSDENKKKVLDEVSVAGIVRYIKSGQCKNIVVMAGAGISTSAGIPDFRSPGSGLYDNLSKYKLPYPQAIFEVDYFQQNPAPFYALAKQLFPGSYKPTYAHYFVRLLYEKNLLLRHFTQNIDGLEKVAGIPGEKIVEAHGTFYTSHCLSCGMEYSLDWIKEKIFQDVVPHCIDCQGLVKPDIVFFGENLPARFFSLAKEDFPKADLLIIMGSSLAVQPFSSQVDRVSLSCPRILMNREKAGQKDKIMSIFGFVGGLDLDSNKNYRDVAFLGDCDDLCRQLVEQLEWTEDFEKMMNKCT